MIDFMFDRNDLDPGSSVLITGGGWTVVASSAGLIPGGMDTRVGALPADTEITTTVADASSTQYDLVYRFNPTAGTTTVISFTAL